MKLEIITPEKKMFEGEVDAVQFPGVNGLFQVLKGHAPIISALSKGTVKVDLADGNVNFDEFSGSFEKDASNSKVIRLSIKGGVMEMQNDKIIVLAD
ncbi:MAG TPA: F0F1 ATP synthase subunit epsilon [Brumimicrobium sp.]|nr:F0F1 ATP synthase subunit epsilon [Brumimicrobium sp.]